MHKQTVAVNKELLEKFRSIANSEGRKLSYLVEQALKQFISKRNGDKQT